MKRILVIEDSDDLRAEIVDVLELNGFQVDSAPNGRAGLERIKQARPDLVICDLMMPVLDGYGTLKRFRADPDTETLPFLILTGRDERQKMRHGMELGADDYITKPFKIADLLRAVNAAFEKHARIERQSEARLAQLREQIATALPHELRTPLACIMGYAEMLADGDGAKPPQDVALLAQQILGAGQRLHRMSENALLYVQLALLQQGRGDIRAEGASSPTALDQIVACQSAARAGSHGRETDLVLDLAEAPTSVTPTWVERIVDELVENAFKFSQPGTTVRISTRLDAGAVCLRVSDGGCGMSAEQIASLGGFVQFERSVREQQGIGLGFSIAQRVAALWGGTISVESVVGKGTNVTVSLPAWTDSTGARGARPGRGRWHRAHPQDRSSG